MEFSEINPVWVVVIFAVGGIVWKFNGWYHKVNSDREYFHKSFDKLTEKIDRIYERLLTLTSKTIGTGIPLTLTPLGKEVAEDINAKEISNPIFNDVAKGLKDYSAYDIQNECFDFVRKHWESPSDIDRKTKESAFKRGITKHDVLDVIAIFLRDKILASQGKNHI